MDIKQVNKEIPTETKNSFQLNKNENTTYQNGEWNAVKIVLREH